MNKLISKTKIETCDCTWNPCYGCLNNCKYCYARRIAKRFGGIRFTEEWKYRTEHNMNAVYFKLKNSLDLVDFKPIFLHSQFNKKFPQKTRKIFVGSMSEIRFWKREWIERVFEKVRSCPQHIFQFLTKYPYIYHRLEFPAKSWLGFTANNMKDLADGIPHIEKVRMMNLSGKYLYYICIEPILEEINPLGILLIDWVILGAETGNRKSKITPKKEWIENIVSYCRKDKIPIYLKDSLKEIYPEEIKMFPEVR
jgi:protein gp37